MTALSDIAAKLLRVREAIAGSIAPFMLRQLDEQIDRIERMDRQEASVGKEEAPKKPKMRGGVEQWDF